MTAEELGLLAEELGLDAVGATRAEAYTETERHIRERRERGLFGELKFTTSVIAPDPGWRRYRRGAACPSRWWACCVAMPHSALNIGHATLVPPITPIARWFCASAVNMISTPVNGSATQEISGVPRRSPGTPNCQNGFG